MTRCRSPGAATSSSCGGHRTPATSIPRGSPRTSLCSSVAGHIVGRAEPPHSHQEERDAFLAAIAAAVQRLFPATASDTTPTAADSYGA